MPLTETKTPKTTLVFSWWLHCKSMNFTLMNQNTPVATRVHADCRTCRIRWCRRSNQPHIRRSNSFDFSFYFHDWKWCISALEDTSPNPSKKCLSQCLAVWLRKTLRQQPTLDCLLRLYKETGSIVKEPEVMGRPRLLAELLRCCGRF